MVLRKDHSEKVTEKYDFNGLRDNEVFLEIIQSVLVQIVIILLFFVDRFLITSNTRLNNEEIAAPYFSVGIRSVY